MIISHFPSAFAAIIPQSSDGPIELNYAAFVAHRPAPDEVIEEQLKSGVDFRKVFGVHSFIHQKNFKYERCVCLV